MYIMIVKVKIVDLIFLTKKQQIEISNYIYNEWKDDFINKLNIYNKLDYLERMLESSHTHILFIDNKIVGIISLSINDDIDIKLQEIWVCNVFVVKEYRNQGIGLYLLKHIEEYAISKNIKKLKLWCENNLINFYSKNNWIYLEKFPLGKDNVVMIKNLI